MNDGARVEVRDARVTSLAQWVNNLVQTLVVIVLCFVARNLWEVNLTLAADAETKKAMLGAIAEDRQHLERHDAEIGQLQRDVISIGGSSYRGGQFIPPEDRRRGR